jgi:hypothetical protein
MFNESLTSLFVFPIDFFGNEISKWEKEIILKEFNKMDIDSTRLLRFDERRCFETNAFMLSCFHPFYKNIIRMILFL